MHNLKKIPFGLMLVILSGQADAQSVDVKFSATIRETTCDMKIVGGSGDGLSNTIPIGTSGRTSLDKIIANDSSATTTFSLKIDSCPTSLSSLKTTVSGSQSGYVNTAIINGIATGAGGAEYMGVSIARVSGGPAFVINSVTDSQRLVWTTAERSAGKVDLLARLVITQSGQATPGDFSAVATFNFTYN